MKITKNRIMFFILHLAFSAIIPISLVIVQYSSIGGTNRALGFKISITGVLLILFVFGLIKKLFIDSKIADLKIQSNVMLADLKTKQDIVEIKALEKEIKFIKTTEVALDAIMPLLFIVVGVVAFKALEEQLVKLSSTLGYIAISYFIGVVFNVLYSREVHAKDRR